MLLARAAQAGEPLQCCAAAAHAAPLALMAAASATLTGKLTAALRKAHVAEPAFLKDWREPDKALFCKYTAEQEALHEGVPLSELTVKVARQTRLLATHTADKCYVVDGKLSFPAALHATLLALRKCQAAASLEEQANPEKLKATTFSWLQVRCSLAF